MAIFGAPVAGNDYACRAVFAALGMLEGIARINVSIAWVHRRISVGIGIATDEMMVGVFDFPWEKEYTAFGALVNLAIRPEHGAHEDQILICCDTARRVEDFVQLDKMYALVIHGFARSPDVYGVIGRK